MFAKERVISFCPVVFCVNPPLHHIREINDHNIYSGLHKKNELIEKIKNNKINQIWVCKNEAELKKLLETIKGNAIVVVGDSQIRDWYIYKNGCCEETYASYTFDENFLLKLENLKYQNDVALKEAVINVFLAEKNKWLLDFLAKQIKTGCISSIGVGTNNPSNEVITLLTEIGPPAFTQDIIEGFPIVHIHSRKLQAIHLLKARQKYYDDEVSVFEFSANWQELVERKYSQDEIIKMWNEMTIDYIKKELVKTNTNIFDMSVDEIKINAMYGNTEVFSNVANQFMPADIYYDEDAKKFITENIAVNKHKLIYEYAKPMIDKFCTSNAIFSKKSIDDFYEKHLLFIKIYKSAVLLKLHDAAQNIKKYALQVARIKINEITYSYQFADFIHFIKLFAINNEIQEHNDLKKTINNLLRSTAASDYDANNFILTLFNSKIIEIEAGSENAHLIKKWALENLKKLKLLFEKKMFSVNSQLEARKIISYYLAAATLSKIQETEQNSHLLEIMNSLILKNYPFGEGDFDLVKRIIKISPFSKLGLLDLTKDEYLLQLDAINQKLKSVKSSTISTLLTYSVNYPAASSSLFFNCPTTSNQYGNCSKIEEIQNTSDSNLIGRVLNPDYKNNIEDIVNEAIKRTIAKLDKIIKKPGMHDEYFDKNSKKYGGRKFYIVKSICHYLEDNNDLSKRIMEKFDNELSNYKNNYDLQKICALNK